MTTAEICGSFCGSCGLIHAPDMGPCAPMPSPASDFCNALNVARTYACELVAGHVGQHRAENFDGGYHRWTKSAPRGGAAAATAAAKEGTSA